MSWLIFLELHSFFVNEAMPFSVKLLGECFMLQLRQVFMIVCQVP